MLPNYTVIDGVTRPTTNSNHEPIHDSIDGVISFWRWYGDSPFIDEAGRPVVFYKGISLRLSSDEDSYGFIDTLDAPTNIWAAFVTPDFGFAERYADETHATSDCAQVLPLYVQADHVERIDVIPTANTHALFYEYLQPANPLGAPLHSGAMAIKNGADAVAVYRNDQLVELVVSRPEQMKIANGQLHVFDASDQRFCQGNMDFITPRIHRGEPRMTY